MLPRNVSNGIEKDLQQQVREAYRHAQPLNIIGGASKAFYGRACCGRACDGGETDTTDTPINLAAHQGVIHYDPAELVLTARAGTRVTDLEEMLALKNQMLGFEPPRFTCATTIGGAVAAGLAGPRRPFAGALRDFMLGVKILSGAGDIMRFGGEVMKNVAGFDIARLMAGAMGTLGILLEISLRIVPQPSAEKTMVLRQANPTTAIALFNRLAGRPLPLSAAAWCDGAMRIRLSSSAAGVKRAAAIIGGEVDANGRKFWQQLRDHQLPFFQPDRALLRVSVPPATALNLPANAVQLIDWGGAQRWISGAVEVDSLRTMVARHGGHVTCFRDTNRQDDRDRDVFHPLAPAIHTLHLRLKRAFDPAGILNPGRLYRNL